MEQLEDKIMKVCEGSTYSETMYALGEGLCRRHYLQFASGEPHRKQTDDLIIKTLSTYIAIIEQQINNRFMNHLEELRMECLKKLD